jgi:threonine/homoserine/homoserine lactone efflux protein
MIWTGFLCNALNPKAPIYFVALFTVVLPPTVPSSTIALCAVVIMTVQLFWFSLVAVFLSNSVIHQQFKRFGHWINRGFGVAMLSLGIKILVTRVDV